MKCHAGWLWAGILVTAGLYVTCRTSPAIGQARDEDFAATAAVDQPADQKPDASNSRRTGKAQFESDDRIPRQSRKAGAWKLRSPNTKSNSKPALRFNPFARAKNPAPRDPFVESDADTETDLGTESETDSDDTDEPAPSGPQDLKNKRKAVPQGRKRLLRYQSSTSSTFPADQPVISEKVTATRPAPASASRSETLLKNVSADESDSEAHLRSLFEGPEETAQVDPKPNDATIKPAAAAAVDATSELEIQRVRPRRTITTRAPRATLPGATEAKPTAGGPAAKARVDQPTDEPVTKVALPTIRPAPKPIHQSASTQAPQPVPPGTATSTAEEPEFGPPLMQPNTHSMRSTVSSSLQSVANRPFQIEPPAGWSASTKPQRQSSSTPAMVANQVPRAIDQSLSRAEPLGEVAGQLEFPPLPGDRDNEMLPINQQPVTIDSIEDSNPVQTTHAQETPQAFDAALFVQEESVPNPEPARIQDSFPEPVVIAELAQQNQSPWLWWMLSAFGAGFGLCLMWCIWLRNPNAE